MFSKKDTKATKQAQGTKIAKRELASEELGKVAGGGYRGGGGQ